MFLMVTDQKLLWKISQQDSNRKKLEVKKKRSSVRCNIPHVHHARHARHMTPYFPHR